MTKIRKKRWKKMPWSKYRSIEKRFLDLRFTGVENALNHYARCEEGDRDKQYVFDNGNKVFYKPKKRIKYGNRKSGH